MQIIRLFIVEDQPTILKSQIKLLGQYSDITIVGTAMSGEEAISELSKLAMPPHVVLCDLGLPKMTGIETVKSIKAISQNIEILIFSVFEEENKVIAAIQAGASGYLLKGADSKKIYEAIRETFYGGTVIQPSLARRLLKYFAQSKDDSHSVSGKDAFLENYADVKAKLTSRELECLQIIAKGLNNVEVASVLNLSRATIRTHLEHIYQKLQVTNRVEAITEGIRQGIIEL